MSDEVKTVAISKPDHDKLGELCEATKRGRGQMVSLLIEEKHERLFKKSNGKPKNHTQPA